MSALSLPRALATLGALGLLHSATPGLVAHVDSQPSVHDTVAAILDRFGNALTPEQLRTLDLGSVLSNLTPSEREVLATGHLRFDVDIPVVVRVMRDTRLEGEPFWLEDLGFRSTGESLQVANLRLEAWERSFDAGTVKLGVNSIRGGGEHYLVLVRSQSPDRTVTLDGLYPGQLRVAEFGAGAQPYADRPETIDTLPPGWEGWTLVRTLRARRDDGRLMQIFRWTRHASGVRPDQVVLTWSGDPQTSQAIQWRTRPQVKQGFVTYAKRADYHRPRPGALIRVRARTELLEDRRLVNDSRIHRHTVELRGLEPGTAYVYSVGDGSRDGWSELSEFITAPAGPEAFSFIYMGDAQNGLDRWGSLVRRAFRERPDAAFYLMAGDLVDRGNQRDDWDSFFHNARGIFDRRALVPAIGNHECQGGHPTMYLKQFALPSDGPRDLEPGRAYAFEYSNALFVILDSNLNPSLQSGWLDRQLAQSRATWKFVAYHHPAYSSTPGRDNAAVRNAWVPLFDKHQVDLVLQGHDHAYLRTHPLRANQPVDPSERGTIYVVSVSGTKMYRQMDRSETAVGFTDISTYQVLDLQVSGNRLVYRAYDLDGQVRDEFIMEK
jgi:acid phosphatase type 7